MGHAKKKRFSKSTKARLNDTLFCILTRTQLLGMFWGMAQSVLKHGLGERDSMAHGKITTRTKLGQAKPTPCLTDPNAQIDLKTWSQSWPVTRDGARDNWSLGHFFPPSTGNITMNISQASQNWWHMIGYRSNNMGIWCGIKLNLYLSIAIYLSIWAVAARHPCWWCLYDVTWGFPRMDGFLLGNIPLKWGWWWFRGSPMTQETSHSILMEMVRLWTMHLFWT